MAAINDLIAQVEDEALRERLREEVDRLTKQKKFGLVFEEHLPECTPLYDIPVKKGARVAVKEESASDGKIKNIDRSYIVTSISGDMATCYDKKEDRQIELPLSSLVTIAQFGEPIYPYLQRIDTVENAPDSDLWHTLIEADNYHALQLLEYLYAGAVDCIYIDPPYNTGAKDWKYNNDYVDASDAYRHSKWLSMMKKRLILAKRLLNPDESVLIVTIDEKEYLHLGCLLEELFPEARMQMVTCVISSQGSTRDNLFSRADEYLFYVFIGQASVTKSHDDMLNEGQSETKGQLWFQFVRTGKGNLRTDSPNLFYPIYADPKTGKILSIGASIPLDVPKESIPIPEGKIIIWPITADGREARWRTGVDVANRRLKNGLLRLGKTSKKKSGWSVLTVNQGTEDRIISGEVIIEGYDDIGNAILTNIQGASLRTPKTVWNRVSHNAGWHGSKLLAKFLPGRKFPYPKSLYSTQDAIKVITSNKRDALILDFFAGSGTTLHAVNLLNTEDGGNRRCILVTNNEVSDDEAKVLLREGYYPGDTEWEAHGIARSTTWPRTVSSITGCDITGKLINGEYLDTAIPMSEGFRANCAYFKLGFLDKDAVALGRQFKELLPILWMKAGAIGACPELADDTVPDMMILPKNRFAILVTEQCYLAFQEKLAAHAEIETVFIVTDSASAYREMSAGLSAGNTYQLYRDYLDNFRINGRG